MRTFQRFVLALALFAAPAAALDDERSDEEYEELLHRLEIGMSALVELGAEEELAALDRLANQVRDKRKRARAEREERESENHEVREVRRRIQVMRHAVDGFLEAGRHEAAERVEHAMHSRELILERREDEEAMHVRETAPNRGELAELLAASSRMWAEWGHPDRARAVGELADVYAQQWQRQQGIEGHGNPLDRREQRIEVLALARKAHAEAGREDAVHQMDRILHLAELQLVGEDPEAIQQAAEGITMEMIVDRVREAHELYSKLGHGERAAACANLVEYYVRRNGLESGGPDRAEGSDVNRRIQELQQRLDQVTEQLQEIQAVLREMRRK